MGYSPSGRKELDMTEHTEEERNKDLFFLARSTCGYFGYFLVFTLEIFAYLHMHSYFLIKIIAHDFLELIFIGI